MDETVNGDFQVALSQLETAEEFLDFFDVNYDKTLVMTKRIQLLRLYQRILSTLSEPLDYFSYKKALCQAYKQIVKGHELAFEGGCLACSAACGQDDDGY